MADIEWITLNTTAGTGNSAVTWSVPAWTGSTDRSLELRVSVPGTMLSDTVAVTQRGYKDTGVTEGQFYVIINSYQNAAENLISLGEEGNDSFQISLNGTTWTDVTGGYEITDEILGQKLYLRTETYENTQCRLAIGWVTDYEIGGSLVSVSRNGDFHGLILSDADKLTDVSNLTVDTGYPTNVYDNTTYPIFAGLGSPYPPLFINKINGDADYRRIFRLSKLSVGPVFPETINGNLDLSDCFCGCTEMVTAPTLPLSVKGNCVLYYMFGGCTSLVDASHMKLPVSGINGNRGRGNGEALYARMFSGCTSLRYPPALPDPMGISSTCSHRLDEMFSGCTSLTDAVELPKSFTGNLDCRNMYYGCSSLTGATMNRSFYDLAEIRTDGMFTGVSPTGILKVRSDETMSDEDIRAKVGLPSGWTIQRVL